MDHQDRRDDALFEALKRRKRKRRRRIIRTVIITAALLELVVAAGVRFLQRRVAIARALVTRPSLILADEPTGNLDSRTTEDIMEIFRSLHEQGNTIVLITHDNEVAAQAKRIIRIRDGKLSEIQP